MNTATSKILGLGRAAIHDYAVGVVLLAVCAYLAIRSPQFSTASNVSNVLDQVSMIGIITMGMAILLVSANFDLSIGGMACLSSVVIAKVANAEGVAAGVVVGVGVAVLLGALNGLIVTVLRVNSLVATLGTGLAYSGMALLLSNNTAITIESTSLSDFMSTRALGVSLPAYLFAAVIAVSAWYLHVTVAGQQTFAVGGNAEAARYAGVRVSLIRFIPFVLTGLFVGIASVILTGLLGGGVPTAAAAWPLQVVAGAVVGGISIAGGRGTIAMGVLGVLLIGVMNNGLNLLNFDAAYQNITTGTILVVAVAIDAALQASWRGRPAVVSDQPQGRPVVDTAPPHVLGAQRQS
ncbi:ABC transporter permease [Aeromicrobium sp. NPDC092404]|uniref:ABC transporter permease n=1 Tax=Aeromicrobium sp. NPDC092404 TaxID=3154976 RepID=UPI003424BB8C